MTVSRLLLVMRIAALATALGMIAGSITAGNSWFGNLFTAIIGIGFAVLIFALTNQEQTAEPVTHRPAGVVLVVVLIIAIVMWLVSLAGLALAISVGDQLVHWWHALAYLGAAVTASVATVLVRRTQARYDAQLD